MYPTEPSAPASSPPPVPPFLRALQQFKHEEKRRARWLSDRLSAGPVWVEDIETEAAAHGWVRKELTKTRRDLRMIEYRTEGKRYWRLPIPGKDPLPPYRPGAVNHEITPEPVTLETFCAALQATAAVGLQVPTEDLPQPWRDDLTAVLSVIQMYWGVLSTAP